MVFPRIFFTLGTLSTERFIEVALKKHFYSNALFTLGFWTSFFSLRTVVNFFYDEQNCK